MDLRVGLLSNRYVVGHSDEPVEVQSRLDRLARGPVMTSVAALLPEVLKKHGLNSDMAIAIRQVGVRVHIVEADAPDHRLAAAWAHAIAAAVAVRVGQCGASSGAMIDGDVAIFPSRRQAALEVLCAQARAERSQWWWAALVGEGGVLEDPGRRLAKVLRSEPSAVPALIASLAALEPERAATLFSFEEGMALTFALFASLGARRVALSVPRTRITSALELTAVDRFVRDAPAEALTVARSQASVGGRHFVLAALLVSARPSSVHWLAAAFERIAQGLGVVAPFPGEKWATSAFEHPSSPSPSERRVATRRIEPETIDVDPAAESLPTRPASTPAGERDPASIERKSVQSPDSESPDPEVPQSEARPDSHDAPPSPTIEDAGAPSVATSVDLEPPTEILHSLDGRDGSATQADVSVPTSREGALAAIPKVSDATPRSTGELAGSGQAAITGVREAPTADAIEPGRPAVDRSIDVSEPQRVQSTETSTEVLERIGCAGLLFLIRPVARTSFFLEDGQEPRDQRLLRLARVALHRVFESLPLGLKRGAFGRERHAIQVFTGLRALPEDLEDPLPDDELTRRAESALDQLVAALPDHLPPTRTGILFTFGGGPDPFPPGHPNRLLANLLLRVADLSVVDESVDVTLAMEDVDTELRRGGWDLDPGWVPWLGRVIRFHYREARS